MAVGLPHSLETHSYLVSTQEDQLSCFPSRVAQGFSGEGRAFLFVS